MKSLGKYGNFAETNLAQCGSWQECGPHEDPLVIENLTKLG